MSDLFGDPLGLFFVPKYQQLFFRQMAAGKASVSASGAAMSKYDVEVEARLKALETKVEELVVKAHGHAPTTGTTGVQEQLDDLIQRLGRKLKF